MPVATQARSVPFFDYPALFRADEEEFVAVFRDVGRRGAFIKQRDLAEFEAELARFLGVRYVLGVGNATDGLEVALLATGIRPGDEVIFCSHTMLATAAAIHFSGAVPVPVECGTDHLISPEAVAAAVTSRTRAILPTQLNGRSCDMDALGDIAARHGLLIIEDAAQALGSRFRGRCAGTFGAASAISFYPAKALGCLGDGGAVLTDDPEIYDQASALCDFGRNRDGQVVRWGFNSRLDNMQAAFLLVQLKRYGKVMERRRAIACLYQQALEDVPEVVLPPAPDTDARHHDIYQNYEIEAERRDGLKAYLARNNIGTLIQWDASAVHMHPALGFTAALPFTEALFQRVLMLPMNMSVSDQDIEHVCHHIRCFYGSSQAGRTPSPGPDPLLHGRPASAPAAIQDNRPTEELARRIRVHSLQMNSRGQAAHTGAIFSCADILAVLYGRIMRVNPSWPADPTRDRFVLSKGHAAAGLYAVLAERGFFSTRQLESHYGDGSILCGHASHKVPGVEASTGSLGHGLSIAAGMAYAGRLKGAQHRLYCLLGDGECDEGSVWEAALFAGHHRLDNLIAIVDHNRIQGIGATADILNLEPFPEKWMSFGWEVQVIDGHDHNQLANALQSVPAAPARPICIIARTTKGKGVSFMEDSLLWHYRIPAGREYESAMRELEPVS